jgi:hypothetical protein
VVHIHFYIILENNSKKKSFKREEKPEVTIPRPRYPTAVVQLHSRNKRAKETQTTSPLSSNKRKCFQSTMFRLKIEEELVVTVFGYFY